MKIATHNTTFLFDEGTHTHSGKEWQYTKEFVEERINHFAKLFSEIGADVLLLQEVASEKVIKRIIEKSGLGYSYFLANPDENGVGNAVLYKLNDVVCRSVPALSPLPVFVEGDEDVLGSRMWSRRDFVHLETLWQGKPLHVLGLHIKSNFLVPKKGVDGEAFMMNTQISAADGLIRSEIFRFSQARKMREILDEIFAISSDAQIVVGGDFNAEEDNSVFRIIKGVIKKASDQLTGTTRGINKENLFSIFIKDKKYLVDHLLLSQSLEKRITNPQIINTDLFEVETISSNPTAVKSDHALVLIELV